AVSAPAVSAPAVSAPAASAPERSGRPSSWFGGSVACTFSSAGAAIAFTWIFVVGPGVRRDLRPAAGGARPPRHLLGCCNHIPGCLRHASFFRPTRAPHQDPFVGARVTCETEGMSTATVSLHDIRMAHKLLDGVARRTPLEGSRMLSERAGGPVQLKCENLQRTGSFKIRGAYVRIH